jgi:hypothetical protein
MKRKILLFVQLIFGMTIFAQEDAPTSYSSFFNVSASRYEPGILGRDMNHGQFTLINAYSWIGNTTFDRQLFEDIFYGGKTDEELDAYFDELKGTNRFGVGSTIDYFNLGWKIKRKDKELFTFSLGMAERAEANLVFSNDFFKLLWKGNAQFEGETVEFPAFGGGFYTREFTVGVAFPFLTTDKLKLRFGGRYKYIQGLAAFYAEKIDGSLYTEKGGKSNTLNYDYLVNIAFDEDDFDPTKPSGTGHAIDVGVSSRIKERFFANINLLDFGQVKFTKNTTIYKKSGSIKYEGMIVDNILTDDPQINDSILNEIWEDNRFEGEDFVIKYPTRLRVHTSYKIPAEDKKGEEYFKHSVALTYIQGFVDIGNSTKRAYFSTAYTFNLKNRFEVGSNIGLRGYNNLLEFGVFMAFRAGPFRMGVGSGNITPLVKSVGTGVDANFNMTFAF